MDGSQQDEFAELFVACQRNVYAFIVTLLADRTAADDVFQQTSLVLLKKWDQFDPDRNFFTWACGIAHNEARNYLRRQRRGRVSLSEAVMAELAEVQHRHESQIDARLERLADCLGELSAKQRELVQRCYVGDESSKTIAGMLGISPNTIYKRLERIRRLLLECMDRHARAEGT